MNKDESIALIKAVINEMNDMLPDKNQLDASSNDCLKNLDSLQLVNLIVGLEEKIEEDFNKHIVFTLEDKENEISFLDSIESLSDYIIKNI
tara:strand:+ start:462 stop:734 length:273 start_codon:yes stop_codon:yes gene_type:complete